VRACSEANLMTNKGTIQYMDVGWALFDYLEENLDATGEMSDVQTLMCSQRMQMSFAGAFAN
jgi:hypothetical protein